MSYHREYAESGFRVFGLYGVKNERCECGNPDCRAFFKHPRISKWPTVPLFSDEQIDALEQTAHFKTGFGVVVGNHLVIDIDPRNGGIDGYSNLCDKLGYDPKDRAGLVVSTGGGGWHIYFKRPPESVYVNHLKGIDGVDFKTSGFVVGAGSLHASGMCYEIESGSIDEINDAPGDLLLMLEKPKKVRAEISGKYVDVSYNEIASMLSVLKGHYVDDYHSFIELGMAVHSATGGSLEGFQIWDQWASASSAYDPEIMDRKWHSFGKSGNNEVTLGTLAHHAMNEGWQPVVVFESDAPVAGLADEDCIECSDVDLLMPPGLAGEFTRWINDQCRFPRERLAVGAALSALSTIGGLRYIDDDYNICSNLFFFNVAGASSGKDSVLAAQAKLLRQAGMAPAVHGAIKSEQEITRNLVAHQLACYVVDEVGTVLQKITNASKRGGAAYLEGVVGLLMAAFTKSNDTLLISGDLRRDVRKELASQIKQLEKSEDSRADSMIESLEKQLQGLENGLENPFLSLSGYTTPETFSSFVNFENTTNGFLARALIIQERETNPMFKPRFKPVDMPLYIKSAIAGLVSDRTEPFAAGRIEQTGDRIGVKSTPEAIDLLENIALSFHQMAEDSKALGLESVPRRGFEQVLKLSLTLSFGCHERTVEHVKWAYAYVHANVKEKMALIASNVAKDEKRHDEHLMMSILNMLDPVEPVTLGVIVNRNRSYKKEDVQNALNILISNDAIVELDHVPARGKATKKYVLNK